MSRDKYVEAALGVVGLTADKGQPAKRAEYLALIAPGENANMSSSMAHMSGCGLVVAGIWRAASVVHPLLSQPYKIGAGISRLIAIARTAAAWRPYSKGLLPSPGDMVLVGDNGKGGVEHVFTVVEVNGTELVSVDGGQKDAKGFQCVVKMDRLWEGDKDAAKGASDPGGYRAKRRIVGIVDVSKLPVEDIYE